MRTAPAMIAALSIDMAAASGDGRGAPTLGKSTFVIGG